MISETMTSCDTTETTDTIKEITRASVRDVFHKLLAIEVQDEPPEPLPPDSGGQIVASVGFIGQATGIVYLHSGRTLGWDITAILLGLKKSEVDDEMINDAFGELCNMVVGGVKSKLCDHGWPCVLTIPSIMRGNGLRVEPVADVKQTAIGFRVGEHRLLVEMLVRKLSPNPEL